MFGCVFKIVIPLDMLTFVEFRFRSIDFKEENIKINNDVHFLKIEMLVFCFVLGPGLVWKESVFLTLM